MAGGNRVAKPALVLRDVGGRPTWVASRGWQLGMDATRTRLGLASPSSHGSCDTRKRRAGRGGAGERAGAPPRPGAGAHPAPCGAALCGPARERGRRWRALQQADSEARLVLDCPAGPGRHINHPSAGAGARPSGPGS
jgi:hypothetical protein